MGATNLFSGIAVIIDDEIGNEKARISNLIKQIEAQNMPCLEYKALPDIKSIDHLGGIAFLLLDWLLIDRSQFKMEGGEINIPQTIRDQIIKDNVEFIKKLLDRYFIPIFIFTDELKEEIVEILIDNSLIQKNKRNCIFIKKKDELTGRTRLFKTIEDWAKKNISIYVAKEWEKEYSMAKNRMFHDFHKMGADWPKILWRNFSADGVNESLELGETITRNLHTRMSPFDFNKEVLNKAGRRTTKEELRAVLEGARYIKASQLHQDDISTGDIFKEEYTENGETKYRYWVNIRAQCNLVRVENPELYCLRGRLFDENKVVKKGGCSFIDGQFIEKVDHSIVGCIDEGKIVEFLFRDLKAKKWNGLKNKRIGRLLPPFITQIQQRYALYFKRQGLPRTPKEAI